MKRALVLCEVSGIWSNQLHLAGFDVTQVDIGMENPGRRGDNLVAHRADARDYWEGVWDVVCAFPPCTDLSAAGAHLWKKKDVYPGLAFLLGCARAATSASIGGLIENPVGLARRVLGMPDAKVHPWQFAEDASEHKQKRTCFWMYGQWAPPFMVGYAGYNSKPTPFDKWSAFQGSGVRSKSWEGMASVFVSQLGRAA